MAIKKLFCPRAHREEIFSGSLEEVALKIIGLFHAVGISD